MAPYVNENAITIIGICLLIGAMAKSSQVGLHIWLPMAMEGPTPVSALIHAATMVTAGVYLLIRSSPLIEYSSTVLLICLWLGAITTVFSSLIGLFQQDIKKIIAYSTMSQLAREYTTHLSIFRHQTICVEAIHNTIIIANSQITKARDYLYDNHYNFKFFNSSTIIRLYQYLISVLIRWKFDIIILINYLIHYVFCNYTSEGLIYDAKLSISTPYTLEGLGFCTGPMDVASPSPASLQKIFEPNQINPYYITGFTDAEGCFLINVRPNSKMKIGYSVELVFKIALHVKDKVLIENIRNYFNVGTVTYRGSDCIQYWVGSLKDLQVIVQHFENYPLISQKWSDYQLFKQVMDLMKGREHLTQEGLQKIVSRKAVLNNSLPKELKIAFPDTVPVIRPQLSNQIIPDPHWISGFVDGEGCFFIALNSSSNKVGGTVQLKFLVAQHSRDTLLLKSFVNYFNCGNYYFKHSGEAVEFVVSKFKDIHEKILPFFEKYPLIGSKSRDFTDFYKAAQLIKSKVHLELGGLEKIKQIKRTMNKSREVKIGYTIMSKVNKRSYSTVRDINNQMDNQKIFHEWLGGYIDANGQFILTKKGYPSLKLVATIKDKSALYKIRHKYGGSIRSISGSKALKYKLQNKKALISLVEDVNGSIRNPARMLQLNKICVKYNIKLKEPLSLTFSNGWFSGFIDGDGSIHIDENSGQLIISVTQKNNYLLNPLQILYGGRITILSSKEAFKYTIFRKKEILNLVNNYFQFYPLRSCKAARLNLINTYYLYCDHRFLNVNKLEKFNQWIEFKNQWDKL